MPIHRFKRGLLGGKLQIGVAIAGDKLDLLSFFWDPLQAQPHDVDVKALLGMAIIYNIPLARDPSSADFLITSPLMEEPYERFLVDYGKYLKEF